MESLPVVINHEAGTMQVGDLQIDSKNRRCTYKQQVVHLPGYRFLIASLLVKNAGTVVSSEKLCTEVWDDPNQLPNLYQMMTLVRHDLAGCDGVKIITVMKVGYRLEYSKPSTE